MDGLVQVWLMLPRTRGAQAAGAPCAGRWSNSQHAPAALACPQILGTSAVTSRALMETPDLIDWGLLPKALMGLLALLCGNGCELGWKHGHLSLQLNAWAG